MVTGIPKSKTQDDVKEFFERFDPNLEIKYVSCCYDIRDIIKESRKRTRLTMERAHILSEKRRSIRESQMNDEVAKETGLDSNLVQMKSCCRNIKFESLESIDEKINSSKKRIEELEAQVNAEEEKNLFCGT